MGQNQIPTYDRLMNPLLQALRDLGGSGSTDEIYQRVSENLKLPENVLSVLHDPETSNQTEVQYRLAWLKQYAASKGSPEKLTGRTTLPGLALRAAVR
jgi:restriction system protein